MTPVNTNQSIVSIACKQLLGPYNDMAGESSRLAMLYGRLPFTFLETKLRFDQMRSKVSERLQT